MILQSRRLMVMKEEYSGVLRRPSSENDTGKDRPIEALDAISDDQDMDKLGS